MSRSCPHCGSPDARFVEDVSRWSCRACGHHFASAPGSWVEGGEPPRSDPPVESSPAVFVSYGHADASTFVVRLKSDLEARGFSPVWLDLDMIGPGERWTTRIERAILASRVVLAVMTRRSLSPDSICQDEIAFARTEHKRIVPVRLANDPHLRPTLLLVRASWVDFSDDYETAFARLLRALSGDESTLTQPLLSVAGQRPLDFSLDIAAHTRAFTGRTWLIDPLDRWLATSTHRAFVIVGEPGIGKSAIAARLARRTDCAAVHFCSAGNSDSLSPLAFVGSLVAALSARIKGLSEEVSRRRPEEPRADATTAFRLLVVEPARAIPPPDRPPSFFCNFQGSRL